MIKVKLEYIKLSFTDIVKTIKLTDADIEEYYNNNAGQFVIPGKKRISQIIINNSKENIEKIDKSLSKKIKHSFDEMDICMNDDFNTPEAIAVLFNLSSEINKSQKSQDASLLKSLANILGLLQQEPQRYLQQGLVANNKNEKFSESEINLLINQRLEAKKNQDFKEADQIRSLLAEAGIILEDTSQGTTWRRH